MEKTRTIKYANDGAQYVEMPELFRDIIEGFKKTDFASGYEGQTTEVRPIKTLAVLPSGDVIALLPNGKRYDIPFELRGDLAVFCRNRTRGCGVVWLMVIDRETNEHPRPFTRITCYIAASAGK